jgi:lipopolysaccharide biosynthesis regulator YciM
MLSRSFIAALKTLSSRRPGEAVTLFRDPLSEDSQKRAVVLESLDLLRENVGLSGGMDHPADLVNALSAGCVGHQRDSATALRFIRHQGAALLE